MAGGYEVVWKMGADQYILWAVDASGSWLSQSAVLSGASEALVSRETAFQQDLNSDGTIDAPPSLLLADDPFRWFASGLGAIPAVPLSSCRHTARGD